MNSPSTDPVERSSRRVLLGLVAVLILDLALVLAAPQHIGQREDDGVYLVTAKSLADGRGYRHLQLPGEPFQTNYPILYPFALSLIWRCFPTFPANIAVVQVFNAVCAGLTAWIAFLTVRRIWRIPVWLAGAGAILSLAHPATVQLIRDAMSEHLYALLSLSSLLLLSSCKAASEDYACDTDRFARRGVAAVVLASLAFLTRSIGVSLIAAAIVTCLLRRRWRLLRWALLIAAVVIGGWQIRQWLAGRANAAIPQSAAFGYELDYGRWFASGIGDQLRVMAQNAPALAYALLHSVAVLPTAWVVAAVQGSAVGAPSLYIGVAFCVACCAWGLAATWNPARPLLHLYLLFYLIMVWIWPYHPRRFMVPLFPLLIPCFLLGLLHVGRYVFAGVQRMGRRIPDKADTNDNATGRHTLDAHTGTPMPAAMGCVTVLLLGWYMLLNLGMTTSEGDRRLHNAQNELAETIRRVTPADAVIAWYYGGYFHLLTDRKIVRTLLVENPIDSLYPADRKLRHMGLTSSPGQARAYRQLLEDGFETYRKYAAITHVVERVGERGFGALFHSFLNDRGYRRSLVAEVGPHRIHSLGPP